MHGPHHSLSSIGYGSNHDLRLSVNAVVRGVLELRGARRRSRSVELQWRLISAGPSQIEGSLFFVDALRMLAETCGLWYCTRIKTLKELSEGTLHILATEERL